MSSAARTLILPLDAVPTAARFGSSSTQTLYVNGENKDEKNRRSNFEPLRIQSLVRLQEQHHLPPCPNTV